MAVFWVLSSTRLHGTTTQMTAIFVLTAVRTSNRTKKEEIKEEKEKRKGERRKKEGRKKENKDTESELLDGLYQLY
jgi:hypothetical protein